MRVGRLDREDRAEGFGKTTPGRAAQQSFKWQVSVQVSYYGLGLTDAPLHGPPNFCLSLGVGTCIGPLAAASADVIHHYTNRIWYFKSVSRAQRVGTWELLSVV